MTKIDELLRDQIWTFLGAVFTGIAILITIVIYFLQRHKKLLGYKIIGQFPLVKIHEKLKDSGQLQVTYSGHVIESVHFLLVEIMNLGNTPITSLDYEKPISFHYDNSSTILNVEVVDAFPKDLSPMLTTSKNSVEVEPLLLNSGDSFLLKFIVKDLIGSMEVHGRVIGVDRINHIGPQPKKRPGKYYVLLGLGFYFAGIFFPKFQISLFGLIYSYVSIRAIFVVLGSALIFYGVGSKNYWEQFLEKRSWP